MNVSEEDDSEDAEHVSVLQHSIETSSCHCISKGMHLNQLPYCVHYSLNHWPIEWDNWSYILFLNIWDLSMYCLLYICTLLTIIVNTLYIGIQSHWLNKQEQLIKFVILLTLSCVLWRLGPKNQFKWWYFCSCSYYSTIYLNQSQEESSFIHSSRSVGWYKRKC